MRDEVTLDIVDKIFSQYSTEYQQIKKIAEKDIGQELIDRIDKFLAEREEEKVPEIKRIVFEDPSKVADEDINNIVDAFVKIRSQERLTDIDRKSIDDILILFNKWIDLEHTSSDLTDEVIDLLPERDAESLEAEIQTLEKTAPKPEYQIETFELPQETYNMGEIYQPGEQSLPGQREDNPFYKSSEYKMHTFEQ